MFCSLFAKKGQNRVLVNFDLKFGKNIKNLDLDGSYSLPLFNLTYPIVYFLIEGIRIYKLEQKIPL
jgi:hypothetical protein